VEIAMNLEERMLRSVRQRNGNVVLRSELADLGSASQVTQALKSLQRKGVLVRIGTGVYAKTRKSSVTGATIPAGSLETLAAEVFSKLGVEVSVGSLAAAYNDGSTTQLPGAFVANTGRRRISRQIAVGGRAVVYENDYSGTARGA
jgi:predicted transcriptional regulator of viral defense system